MKWSEELNDIVTALQESLDDDEFVALMDRANESKAPDTVLREAYSTLVAEGADVTPTQILAIVAEQDERIAKAGMRIEEVYGPVQDPRTREVKEVLLGYELSREIDGRKLYSGVSGAWGVRYAGIPWPSYERARSAAIILLDVEAERPQEYPFAVKRYVCLYVAAGIKPATATAQINVRMSLEETTKMDAIVRGLRSQNVEVEKNKPVDSYAQALRYLLSQVSLP